MTATVAGRLVDRGLLSFNDTIGQVLGGTFPAIAPAYRDVPLWKLLTHRSGLPHDLDRALMHGRPSRQQVVRRALETPPVTERDAAGASYSNLGFAVTGVMLETRGGRSFEDLMRQEVFTPLNLQSGGFGHPEGDQPVGEWPGGALGLVSKTMSSLSPEYMRAIAPAGDVHMSLPDFITYLAAHRDRTALLHPATWNYLHRDPANAGIAMGWGVSRSGVLTHSGSDGYFYAVARIDPQSGVVAVAAANRGGADDPLRQALDLVAKAAA